MTARNGTANSQGIPPGLLNTTQSLPPYFQEQNYRNLPQTSQTAKRISKINVKDNIVLKESSNESIPGVSGLKRQETLHQAA